MTSVHATDTRACDPIELRSQGQLRDIQNKFFSVFTPTSWLSRWAIERMYFHAGCEPPIRDKPDLAEDKIRSTSEA